MTAGEVPGQVDVMASYMGEIDTFLGECDARSYAPSGSELGLDKDFHGQATRLAEEIAESGR